MHNDLILKTHVELTRALRLCGKNSIKPRTCDCQTAGQCEALFSSSPLLVAERLSSLVAASSDASTAITASNAEHHITRS